MRLSLLLPFLLLCLTTQAQRFSRVKIQLDQTHTLHDLAKLGLDVEHGQFQPGKYFTGEFSDAELAQLQAAGFSTEILVADLTAHLLELNRQGVSVGNRSLPPCFSGASTQVQTPANYTYGSMGGYQTYQEMLDILDLMAATYPQIFKGKQPMSDTLTTIEGRPIYWVKISDNPNDDEAGEPEIFFNAITHAREPNGMSQLLFFIWHLLENYDSDPEVKFLVDNSEIYIAPCLNPDGYLYNESTNPDGGGFWRKNRRLNDDGSYGVDLNRNYGYEWGHDDGGSSPNPGSQTYRGTAPFSEPETRMVRDFCIAHEFQMAFNYHTYSDLLIHSWDFEPTFTPDHATFTDFAELMTQENGYQYGTSNTVLYPVNGGVNDWMYGDTAKQKILAFLPEVGPGITGFWPPQSDIDKLNKDAFSININALRLLHNYGLATPAEGQFIQNLQEEQFFSLKKMGLQSGALTVSLEPLSGNVASVGQAKVFNLSNLEETADAFEYSLDPAVQNGDSVIFDLVVDNGDFAWRQKIVRIYTTLLDEALFDPAANFSYWQSFGSNWDLTGEDYVSAPASITDSPNSFYPQNSVNDVELDDPVKVKNAEAIYLNFWAKWDIEEDEDYAQVLVNFDGGNYVPLCGTYSEPGTSEQVLDQPVYDGTQQNWVYESIDLSEYLALDDSLEIGITFRMVADGFLEADGFYFDDLSLTVVEKSGVSSTRNFDPAKFSVSTRPNPAFDQVIFDLSTGDNSLQEIEIQVVNVFGQTVHRQSVRGKTARLDVSDWQAGAYFFQATVEGEILQTGRFLVR